MSVRGRLASWAYAALLAPAAVLVSGCNLGLDPFPEEGSMPYDAQEYDSLGLDPFPEEGSMPYDQPEFTSLGFDIFPDEGTMPYYPSEFDSLGLDVFPEEGTMPYYKPEYDSLGLDPFPEPVHPGGRSSLGLNPFPRTAGQTGPTLPPTAPRYRNPYLDPPPRGNYLDLDTRGR